MDVVAILTVGLAGSHLRGDSMAIAAARLYEAECALRAARQTGVDAWIAAAAEKLHRADQQYAATLAEDHGLPSAG